MSVAIILAVIFWVCMIVWFVNNLQSGPRTFQGWIPFICVFILGLATIGFPFFTGTHVH